MEHGHPGLTSVIKITSNPLAMEFDACAKFGVDPYTQIMTQSREWRAAKTAHHIGHNMIEAMRAHDTKPKDKRRGKNK